MLQVAGRKSGWQRLSMVAQLLLVVSYIDLTVGQQRQQHTLEEPFESLRISSQVNCTTVTTRQSGCQATNEVTNVTSGDRIAVASSTKTTISTNQTGIASSEQLVSSETRTSDAKSTNPIRLEPLDAQSAPVYKSAPKHVNDLAEAKPQTATGPKDLSGAAGGHYKKKYKKKHKIKLYKKKPKKKKKKKKKVVHVKYKKAKKKPKKKKKKIKVYKIKKKPKKKKKKKVKVIKVHKKKHKKHHKAFSHHSYKHLAKPVGHHSQLDHSHLAKASHHQPHHGYYDYRSVPAKGVWNFAYARGNPMHNIERKEHGHKSHFKTHVTWKSKKGHGSHVFDYNHGHHKGHQYHKAAASSPTRHTSLPSIQQTQASTIIQN